MRGLKKRIEVPERAKKRVDGAVVANVIPKVSHRRGKDRGDPNRADSEIDQVLQSERNPLEIADAIPIRVPGTIVDIPGRSLPAATKCSLA